MERECVIDDPELADRPYEIIWGKRYYMASAIKLHNVIILNLILILGKFIEQNNLKHQVFSQGIDLPVPDKFRAEHTKELIPDLLLVTDPEIIPNTSHYYNGVPSLVIEVLSRGTAKRDLGIKKNVYEAIGIPEYWTINIFAKSIMVWKLKDGRYEVDDEYQVPPESLESDEEWITVFYTEIYGEKLPIDLYRVFKNV
jgi:Uma2 family endonuclease